MTQQQVLSVNAAEMSFHGPDRSAQSSQLQMMAQRMLRGARAKAAVSDSSMTITREWAGCHRNRVYGQGKGTPSLQICPGLWRHEQC